MRQAYTLHLLLIVFQYCILELSGLFKRMASAQKPLCVLSLGKYRQYHMTLSVLSSLKSDGGGVRGLSELVIIEKLMVKIQEQSKAASPPKPCDVFDLICGTSTGGIIAFMLGRLRMSIQEVKDQYCEISERIFGHPKIGIGKGRDKFSATTLEMVMKETIEKYSGRIDPGVSKDPDLKLLEGDQDAVGCKV